MDGLVDRGAAMSAGFRCPRHGLALTEGSRGCPWCVMDLRTAPPPGQMPPQARAAEVRLLLDEPLTVSFREVWRRIDALVGRPTWTHEMADPASLAAEAESWVHPADLDSHALASLRALAGDKPIVVVRS